jgi:hypothetical protein
MRNNKQLGRSASTPHIRDADAASDSDDKKRNKLGYQRISIACGMLMNTHEARESSGFKVWLTFHSALPTTQDQMHLIGR